MKKETLQKFLESQMKQHSDQEVSQELKDLQQFMTNAEEYTSHEKIKELISDYGKHFTNPKAPIWEKVSMYTSWYHLITYKPKIARMLRSEMYKIEGFEDAFQIIPAQVVYHQIIKSQIDRPSEIYLRVFETFKNLKRITTKDVFEAVQALIHHTTKLSQYERVSIFGLIISTSVFNHVVSDSFSKYLEQNLVLPIGLAKFLIKIYPELDIQKVEDPLQRFDHHFFSKSEYFELIKCVEKD